MEEETLYNLHKAGVINNIVLVFFSFLTARFYRKLVNSDISDWAYTNTSFPQGSLLHPFVYIFLVFTTDMTVEEPKQTPEITTEPKYVDNFEF